VAENSEEGKRNQILARNLKAAGEKETIKSSGRERNSCPMK